MVYCAVHALALKCHTSVCPPDVILRRSLIRPSTVLAVIEGLGTRLMYLVQVQLVFQED